MSKKKHQPRVIAYGCSFTAGAELLDHLFHEDSEQLKRQLGWEFMHRYRLPHKLRHDQARTREGEMAWAGQLAQIWGQPLINQAVHGSSLTHAVYALERDMAQGLIAARDTVLVGVTSRERITWFGRGEHNMILSGGPQVMPQTQRWDHHTIIDFWHDRDIELLHTQQLLRLVQISEKQPLYMCEMLWREPYPDPVTQRRWYEIWQSPSWVKEARLYDHLDGAPPHAGGHPRIEAHIRFAQWLSTRIRPGFPDR